MQAPRQKTWLNRPFHDARNGHNFLEVEQAQGAPMHAHYNSDDGIFDCPEEVLDDPNDEVGLIIFRLQHAGREHNFAFNVDMVLLQVEKLALGKATQSLSQEQFLRISGALGDAAEAGYSAPPVGLTPDQTMHGLLMLGHAIAFWHLPEVERNAKPRRRYALRNALRIFRNVLHNSCLLVDVTEEVAARSLLPVPSAIADMPAHPENLDFPSDALLGFVESFSGS
ncbi:hypothetical protein [Devosia alba]|uniref:hypothetical protein n=1 Tax=Devosia alba TaxID=3152360 RepID=UPI0032668592